MKKIFRYPILMEAESKLAVPAGAKILSVMVRGNTISLYAIIDTEIEIKKEISIRTVETGQEILFDVKDFTFLGTVLLDNGNYVLHVYYRDHGYFG